MKKSTPVLLTLVCALWAIGATFVAQYYMPQETNLINWLVGLSDAFLILLAISVIASLNHVSSN